MDGADLQGRAFPPYQGRGPASTEGLLEHRRPQALKRRKRIVAHGRLRHRRPSRHRRRDLVGRTKDKNIGYIAEYLTDIGIDLREVRVVPDVEAEIVAAVNALRDRYTYLFTTGGIGPTHDDITADCVAKAFGVPIDIDDPRAVAMMLERYKPEDLNEARLRMARIPAGAELIENPISKAPGFRIGNVIVMAGVPAIMQAMLDNRRARRCGPATRMVVETVEAEGLPEGMYAAGLAAIAKRHASAFRSAPTRPSRGRIPQPDRRSRQGRRRGGGCRRRAVRDLVSGASRADRSPALIALRTSELTRCRPRPPKPSPSHGTSSTATRGRWPGDSLRRARSRRSSALPGAGSFRRRSSRANSTCG